MASRGVAFIAGLAFAAASSAQPVPPPAMPPRVMPAPRLMVPPQASAEEAAAFRQKMDDYTRCTHDNERAMRLAEASRGLASMRDGRPFWEDELRRNASLQQRYPQGYGQMLDEAFRLYRSLGGPAASVAAVTAIAPPCTNPWETYRPKGAPLSQSRSMPVPQAPK